VKFLVEIYLDGYESEEEHDKACAEFVYDQLNMTASCVKVTPIPPTPKPEERTRE